MVTEDYVSFETAKLLKEKGFNEECFALYNPDGMLIQSGIRLNNAQVGIVKSSYSAPTQQMAMRWLREVHNIHINLDIHWLDFANSKGWMYVIETILENGVEFVDCKDGVMTLVFRGECSKCHILDRCTQWMEEKIEQQFGEKVKIQAVRRKPYFWDVK